MCVARLEKSRISGGLSGSGVNGKSLNSVLFGKEIVFRRFISITTLTRLISEYCMRNRISIRSADHLSHWQVFRRRAILPHAVTWTSTAIVRCCKGMDTISRFLELDGHAQPTQSALVTTESLAEGDKPFVRLRAMSFTASSQPQEVEQRPIRHQCPVHV